MNNQTMFMVKLLFNCGPNLTLILIWSLTISNGRL